MVIMVNGKAATTTEFAANDSVLVIAGFAETTEAAVGGISEEELKTCKSIPPGRFETGKGYFSFKCADPFVEKKSTQKKREVAVLLRSNRLFILFEDPAHIDELATNMDKKVYPDLSLTLVRFFDVLTFRDFEKIEAIEKRIENLEERVIEEDSNDANQDIFLFRRKLFRIKSYYGSILNLFSEMMENQDGLISKEAKLLIETLSAKLERDYSTVTGLQEFLTEVREEYQAQVDLSMNRVMKVFTVITTVFLPLSILVGWYGMNVNVPEYEWEYGYFFVIGLGLVMTFLTLFLFRKKKWF